MREPNDHIRVRVHLSKPSVDALEAYGEAVDKYAERLAKEAENQKWPGWKDAKVKKAEETTAEHVAKADIAIRRYGEQARRAPAEIVALAGWSILSPTAGVLGSYLNSGVQWAAFSATAFLGVSCFGWLLTKKKL